ncbi:hypothetical protein L7F22_025348 [Adiantum nelumboides]|nr:hypothetical protein [Adiantum nelumboides]
MSQTISVSLSPLLRYKQHLHHHDRPNTLIKNFKTRSDSRRFSLRATAAPPSSDVDDAMKTSTERCPDTVRYDVNDRELKVPKPHIPRALVAADNEHPQGTIGRDHQNYTVLQQHVEFFDRNKDGIIYPWETFEGFRAIGFNYLISFFGMVLINGTMSYATQPSWLPSPVFSIHIRNMHKAVHGSDTGVYDNEGRFVPAKFEEIFAKYAKTSPDRMSWDELNEMTESLKDVHDFFGWAANKLEWGITFLLLKDEEGFVSKELIRGMYDGSVFYSVEKELADKKL